MITSVSGRQCDELEVLFNKDGPRPIVYDLAQLAVRLATDVQVNELRVTLFVKLKW